MKRKICEKIISCHGVYCTTPPKYYNNNKQDKDTSPNSSTANNDTSQKVNKYNIYMKARKNNS